MRALGNVLRARKFYSDAIEAYGKALALVKEPARQHWTLFYFRGISHERAKQWPPAEKDFQKSPELNPAQPQVLNYLGYSWVDQGVNLDQGLEMIKKAVELRPKDGYIIDSLGWAFYRLGRYDEAVKELERAIELRPEDPVINDHLGDAYWKVGRQLEARFQWNIASYVDEPDGTVRPRALAKLAAENPDLGIDAVAVTEDEEDDEEEDAPESEPAPAAPPPAPEPAPAPAAAP